MIPQTATLQPLGGRLCRARPRRSANWWRRSSTGQTNRVRPKLMTVLNIMLGLVPAIWSQGTGASVMKRIAAPMVGGMGHFHRFDSGSDPGALRPMASTPGDYFIRQVP